MEKLRGGGEMTVFNELTHFTLLLLEFESSSYLVSRKKERKKNPSRIFFHSSLQVGSLPLNSGQDKCRPGSENSRLFRKVSRQPLHNIYDFCYLYRISRRDPGRLRG